MKQWLWALYIEEWKGNRSILNGGVVDAETADTAKELAREKIGFNLVTGMSIVVTDDLSVTIGSLINKRHIHHG